MSNEDKYTQIKLYNGFLEKDCDDVEHKLAHLLSTGDIFCNNGWWDESWPKDKVTLHVNCNDIFAWGCADSEDISASEIGDLYEMFKIYPDHAASAWCIAKRKQMPQRPVEKQFREYLPWDLDELIKGNVVLKELK